MAAKRWLLIAIATAALLDGCAARSPSSPITERPPASILASSSPAPGETVRQAVDTLTLHFNPPARLDELTVTGAEGTMPMMVHSAGEMRDYSIPVSGLAAGPYTVDWRATAHGRGYRGKFSFTVIE
jgi:methionine-rich copper-binding protein CopC